MTGGGAGGAKGVKMEKNTVAQLYEKAKQYGIVGRSKMNKSQLIAAIRSKQAEIGARLRLRGRK